MKCTALGIIMLGTSLVAITGCAGSMEPEASETPEVSFDDLAEEAIAYIGGWSTNASTSCPSGSPTMTGSAVVKNETTTSGFRSGGLCIVKRRNVSCTTGDEECGGPGNYCLGGKCYQHVDDPDSCMRPVFYSLAAGQTATTSTFLIGLDNGSYATLSILNNGQTDPAQQCNTQANQQNPALCIRSVSTGKNVKWGQCI